MAAGNHRTEKILAGFLMPRKSWIFTETRRRFVDGQRS